MPPKKPVAPAPVAAAVDTRTPLEIEYDLAVESIVALNDQLQRCKDGILEMATLAAKIRGLEMDLQPKEIEQKNVQAAFSKLVEAASGLKRPVGMLRTQAAAAAAIQDDIAAAAAAETPVVAAGSVSPVQPGSRPGTVPAPILLPPAGANAASHGAASAPPATAPADDFNDKEILRILGAASRSFMLSTLQGLFDTPVTSSEKKAELEDRTDLVALATACKRQENARLDPDLTCPLGVEPSVFFDLLKLRAQRIIAERSASDVIVQLNEAKAAVQKRKDEGASKVLQKRLEKQIEDGRKRVSELQREKDSQEMSRRAAAMLAQQHEPTPSPTPAKPKSAKK
ncbi:Hypothetical protein, putative [Bodo saltans]|uniref:Uncharacterized protein n=1 Tax=Bodo saltans TaxID=75058 RepID=A0A0S4IZ34_BODSA|nr:Hypothetical protein, putative [Bodo saltans]|eukprot:CUF85060.1 Hypothetical protein, putative [Bodo saltans]